MRTSSPDFGNEAFSFTRLEVNAHKKPTTKNDDKNRNSKKKSHGFEKALKFDVRKPDLVIQNADLSATYI